MKLTPNQIESWRMLLALDPQIGAYAQIAPNEEIEKLAEHFQKPLNSEPQLDFETHHMPLLDDQMRSDL